MNKYHSIIFSLLLFSWLFAEDLSSTQKLVNANNDFGFRLFNELVKQEDGKNIFISPTSIAMALAMTYNGADLATKDSMAKTLSIEQIPLKEFNEANFTLKNSLTKKNKKITLNIANSLWADVGTQFKKDFLNTNKKFYGAKVTTLNFADPKSTNTINKWVNDATNSKIKKIIEEIGEDVIAFLINAIYFKGVWKTEFDKDATTDRIFYCFDGNKKLHPMMYQNDKYNYLEHDKFQAVSLPYGNSQMSMYIFLPNKNSDIKEFLGNLCNKNWLEWMSLFTMTEGDIALPRFKVEYDKSLKNVLKTIGMEIAFDENRADFTKMTSSQMKGNIYIGDVKHKTFVDVNEEGTEAAAVTSVQMEIKGAPMYEFSMVVDHPFFCSIVDNKTGAILFMGAVVEPK